MEKNVDKMIRSDPVSADTQYLRIESKKCEQEVLVTVTSDRRSGFGAPWALGLTTGRVLWSIESMVSGETGISASAIMDFVFPGCWISLLEGESRKRPLLFDSEGL